MVIIETSRLLLREFTEEDACIFFEMGQDAEFMKFIGGVRENSVEQQRQAIAYHIENYYKKLGFGFWVAVLRDSGQVVGRCGLLQATIDDTRETEIAYHIARPFWNRGLATEAAKSIRDHGFNELNFDRLISIIDPENIASQKVAIKTGLALEKTSTFRDKAAHIFSIQRPI